MEHLSKLTYYEDLYDRHTIELCLEEINTFQEVRAEMDDYAEVRILMLVSIK